jgi:hypothetical protein
MVKEEELEKFIEIAVMKFETEISLKNIRNILAQDLGKTILDYAIGKYYIKTFIDALEYKLFGKYDTDRQVFIFNQDNETIISLMIKSYKYLNKNGTIKENSDLG